MEATVNVAILVAVKGNILINTTITAINIIKKAIKVALVSSVQKVSLALVVSSEVKNV